MNDNLKIGDKGEIFVNQGERPFKVVAVAGDDGPRPILDARRP